MLPSITNPVTQSVKSKRSTVRAAATATVIIINVLRYHQQADDMDTTRLESTSHGVDSTRKSRVVVCPGCAATVFVRGDVSKCEYCNRYVD